MTVDMLTATAARSEPYRRGSAGYTRITLALFAAGLATFVSMYSAQALLPALSEDFRVGPASAALAVSATTGVLALLIVPASVLSERFGRTRVMVFSAAASCAIGLLLPLSSSMGVLVAGRALQGATLAGIPAVAMAYLAEEVYHGDLGAAMGRYVAGTTIGGLVGRLVPSAVLDISDWRWAMAVASTLALLFAIVMTRTMPPSRHFRPQPVRPRVVLANLAGHLRNPALRVLFGLGFILMGGFVSAYNFLGFRLVDAPFGLPEAAVGLVFLMYLAGTVTSSVAGRVTDRLGRRWVLLAAVVVTAAGLVCTLSVRLPLVLAGMLLFTGGFFAAHSVASGWVGVLATAHRAEASALYLFSYYLGSSVAGAGAGVAYAAGGWPGTVAYIGVLMLVGLGLALTMTRVGRTPVRPVGVPLPG
ncbi:MFS transporter [Rhodococcus sp. NPDC127528]|uniref:MFS transporter n=1 Tax=unclassified Rhodococcus (in: high G+C Gram-positive bacteria) TaxID=192944 RepID=UPI0036451B36